MMNLLRLFLFFLSIQLNAQHLMWAEYIQGKTFDHLVSRDIKIDKHNNIYVFGITKDSFSLNLLDHNENFLERDLTNFYYFIAKYDQNRNLKWHKIISISKFEPDAFMYNSNIDIDENANVYLYGSYPKYAWIQGLSDSLIVDKYYSDFYLILDSNGNKILFDTKKLNKYSVNYGNIISIDTGDFMINYYFDTAFVKIYANTKVNLDSIEIKTLSKFSNHTNILLDARDKKGVSIWHKTLHSNLNIYAESKSKDYEHNIYISGTYSDTLFLDSTVISTNTGKRHFFLKLTKNGDFIYIIDYPLKNTSSNLDHQMDCDEEGNFYTIFNYNANINCDPLQNPNNLITIDKGISNVLLKYSKHGELIWSQEIIRNKEHSSSFNDLKIHKDKIYITTSFYDSVELLSFNSSQKFYTNIFPYKKRYATQLIAIYNLDGDLISAFKLRESYEGRAEKTKIEVDNDGNIILFGDFYDSIDFDPTHEEYLIGDKRMKNLFLAKYKNSLISKDDLDSADIYHYSSSINSDIKNQINIFPNPTSNKLNLELDKSYKDIIIELYDQSGRKMLSKNVLNTNTETIDLQSISYGIYFIQLNLDGTFSNHKIIKE